MFLIHQYTSHCISVGTYTIGVVNLSQNAVLKKILKILQAVKTSGLTNPHIVYLTTPKCLVSQKKQIW